MRGFLPQIFDTKQLRYGALSFHISKPLSGDNRYKEGRWRKSAPRIGQPVFARFRAISGHRVIGGTFPRKRRAATRVYQYRGPPVHLDVPPVCRHGIVRLILWNRHVISWPGRLPAARRAAHANVPLMSLVLLTRPTSPLSLARPAFRAQHMRAAIRLYFYGCNS